MTNFRIAALTTALISVVSVTARAGTITKVSASPSVVVTGQTVIFTEEGTNPCGASNMTYGDGIVITYAIPELPAKQSHVFEKPGTSTVIARAWATGMGKRRGGGEGKPAAAP